MCALVIIGLGIVICCLLWWVVRLDDKLQHFYDKEGKP